MDYFVILVFLLNFPVVKVDIEWCTRAKPQQSLFAKMEASRKAGKTEEQEKREKD